MCCLLLLKSTIENGIETVSLLFIRVQRYKRHRDYQTPKIFKRRDEGHPRIFRIVALQPLPTKGTNPVYNFKFPDFTPESLRSGFPAKNELKVSNIITYIGFRTCSMNFMVAGQFGCNIF